MRGEEKILDSPPPPVPRDPTHHFVYETPRGRFFLRRTIDDLLIGEVVIAVDEDHEKELRKEGYAPVLEAYPNTAFYCFLREELWVRRHAQHRTGSDEGLSGGAGSAPGF